MMHVRRVLANEGLFIINSTCSPIAPPRALFGPDLLRIVHIFSTALLQREHWHSSRTSIHYFHFHSDPHRIFSVRALQHATTRHAGNMGNCSSGALGVLYAPCGVACEHATACIAHAFRRVVFCVVFGTPTVSYANIVPPHSTNARGRRNKDTAACAS